MKWFRKGSAAEMPFLEHLEELRWRLLWSLIGLVAMTILSFFAVMHWDVVGLLKRPIDPFLTTEDGRLIYLGVTDAFFVSIKVALAMGFVLASPIVFYQIWAFLSPALMPQEKRAIVPALYLGVVLFAAGVALAYFIALPFTLQFLLAFQTDAMVPQITAGRYFAFVLGLMLGFGIMFEFPVVVLVLSALNIVTAKFLASKRRYAFAVMVVAAALITPGDAITATLVLLIPLQLLYELSIGLAKLIERGRARASAAEALPGSS